MTTLKNRRLIRWLAVTVVMVMMATFAGAQNLISNGAFDNGIQGWTEWASDFQLIYHPDLGSALDGGSGPGCLEERLSSWDGGAIGPFQDIPVTPGTAYTLGGSVYLPNSEDNLARLGTIKVDWWNADDAYIASDFFGPPVSDRGVWVRHEAAVFAPAGAAMAHVELMVATPNVENETRPGVAYFDDVVFTSTELPRKQQVLFIPAAASAHGRNGTLWTTTGWFANRTHVPLELEGAFLYQGKDNSSALIDLTTLGTVPAGGFLEVRDLVARLGAAGKTGGIYLVATAQGEDLPAELVAATSYTFTANPGGEGAYGQGVSAVGRAGGTQVVIIPGVYQGGDHRTNIGVLNTSGVRLDLLVNVLNQTGSSLGSATWTLLPYEQKQVSVTRLGVQEVSGGCVLINQRGTGGSFKTYATVVDEKTGDAVYTPGS